MIGFVMVCPETNEYLTKVISIRRNGEGCSAPIALRFKSNQVDGYRTSDLKGILQTLNHLDDLMPPRRVEWATF